MSTRRERAKALANPLNNERVSTTLEKQTKNPRKDKLADFMIDVAKYVFTGVVITSLFNDVTDKTMLYVTGMFIVVVSLGSGLILTEKKKVK